MMPFEFRAAEKGGLNILCLGAHSDDIEIGCGATLLKLIAAGMVRSIQWVVFTSGGTRRTEAQNSADAYLADLNQKEIILLDYKDAFLPFSALDIKAFFNEKLKPFQPDLVLTHYRDDRHQDHRLISDLSWNTFRDHCILEYEIPKYDGDLGIPNCFCKVDEDIAQKKVNLLMTHFATQAGKHWFDPETFLGLMRLRGLESGGNSRYAEAFYARKMVF
ncbi:MAG: PIG-L deacetylase family protein [Bacteroidota bacterium]